MLLGIIGWIAIGLLIGQIATKVINLKGDDPWLGVGLAGVGGLIGGWLFSAVSSSPVSAFNVWSMFAAAAGAGAFTTAWHYIRSRATPVEYHNRRYNR
jgi:uncharacterized membrane protein YeaQ/YmgE (transglycosylase-associated protein family)